MKRILLVAMMFLAVLGCAEPDKGPPAFEKVEVERLLPLNAKAKTTITDPAEVARVAALFPGMARGKTSDIAAGWKAAYRLRFIPAKGDAVKITVDSHGQLWSEGQGDWRAKPGLKEHLDRLLDKKEGEQSDAGWSEEVRGLRGRLVRRSRPAWKEREVIDLHVELKNVSADRLAVQNDPASLHLRVFDADGRLVDPTLPPDRSGPVGPPQWGILPRGCYLGFSLYDYGVGITPGPGAHLALLPPIRYWDLKPGKYTLRGTVEVQPTESETYRKIAWRGRLDLPPLEIEVR